MTERFPTRTTATNLRQVLEGQSRLPAALHRMGFNSMRPGQAEIINMLLSDRDVICILPTGGGKTALWVLPALAMDWPVLVFSPLTALMRDQVQSLQRRGIAAAAVTGLQTDAENQLVLEQWIRGDIQFLFVAPERMANVRFMEVMRVRMPYVLVVDECHCLSAWSDSFREHYKFLGDFVREFNPQIVVGMTATITKDAEDDVRRVLGIGNATTMEFYSRRENLVLSSEGYPGDDAFVAWVTNHTKGSTIVYCTSIKRVEEYAGLLSMATNDVVAMYHGDMDPGAKRTNMDLFMSGKARIVVATNAFGMGIDHASIRHIVHRDIPKSVEALSQEVGRAGRDDKTSWCKMFYSDQSLRTAEYFVRCENPTEDDVRSVFRVLKMMGDVATPICASAREMGGMCGLDERAVGPILTRLKSALVIERSSERPTIAGAEFFDGIPHVPPAFISTRDVIHDQMIEMKGNLVRFDITKVATELGVQPDTLKARLRSYNEQQLLKYVPPFRGTPISIIGNINQVEFKRLAEQAVEARIKLQAVLDYHQTPDGEKHAFLENFYGQTHRG